MNDSQINQQNLRGSRYKVAIKKFFWLKYKPQTKN